MQGGAAAHVFAADPGPRVQQATPLMYIYCYSMYVFSILLPVVLYVYRKGAVQAVVVLSAPLARAFPAHAQLSPEERQNLFVTRGAKTTPQRAS